MAILDIQAPSAEGAAVTLAAAAGGGDSFPNGGETKFRVRNAGAGSVTVTFDSPNTCSFGVSGALHDRVVVVPNDSAVYEVGPFSVARFNDENGRVQVTYTGVTSVTVAAVAR